MRKISFLQIITFVFLFAMGLGISYLITWSIWKTLFQEMLVLSIVFIVVFYMSMIVIFRLFQWKFPLKTGAIEKKSTQEFIYHVYLLFFLMFFYPIMRSGFVPVPFMRLFYLSMGAKLGKNTYSSGIIFDPKFVEIGANSIVGQSAMLIPHNLEGNDIAHETIKIGNNTTVGANAVVLSGVVIEDNAVIAISAVVTRGSVIKKGEVWGGIPAKRLSKS